VTTPGKYTGNTGYYPHDNAPDCPDCETDVFVIGSEDGMIDWRCLACGRTFHD
jgi:ribosomal protein L37AE/L43A